MSTPTAARPRPAPGSCRPWRRRSRCSAAPGSRNKAAVTRMNDRARTERTMPDEKYAASIRNIAEEPWQEFPAHIGGALSKALLRPETAVSRQLDYRILTYQPLAYVKTPTHQAQEPHSHVLDSEWLMEIAGMRRVRANN